MFEFSHYVAYTGSIWILCIMVGCHHYFLFWAYVCIFTMNDKNGLINNILFDKNLVGRQFCVNDYPSFFMISTKIRFSIFETELPERVRIAPTPPPRPPAGRWPSPWCRGRPARGSSPPHWYPAPSLRWGGGMLREFEKAVALNRHKLPNSQSAISPNLSFSIW